MGIYESSCCEGSSDSYTLLRENQNFPVTNQELVGEHLNYVVNSDTNISEGREAAINHEKAELCFSVLTS